MRLDVERPSVLIDLTALPLAQIEATENGLRIGALVPKSDLAYHPNVVAQFPVLSQALFSRASPQLRNMASPGGNPLQRTRCPYFRDIGVRECNKREPGTGCAARTGYTRMHAVVGASDACIAVNPSDMCVALAVLDAVVHVHGDGGERAIPFEEFHRLPGERPEIETALEHGELITHVEITRSPRAQRSRYVKVRDRASYAFALASVAVALEVEAGEIREARVAFGGIAPKPWRSREAENALKSAPATRASFERAAQAALRDAQPLRDNAFKVELARRALVRALEDAMRPA